MLDYLLDFFVFFFGTCFGSFLTMLSYRIFHQGEDFIFKRSYCPKCLNQLKNISLIPIFSWLFQGGKCTFCKSKISIRYPLIELINGLAFLTVFKLNNSVIDFITIYFWLFATFLLLVSIVDIEHLCIPNEFQYVFCGFAFVYIFYTRSSIFYHIFSGIVYYMMITVISKLTSNLINKESIGSADIPLISISGMFLGIKYLHIFLLFCGISGLFFGMIYNFINKRNGINKSKFPFAPSIIISFIITFYILLINL